MKEMEGFEKGFSPSRSTGENNENDPSQDNIMIPQFQTHKKVVVKNFMLPTISAASKAAAPRKKILAERNENSSNFDGQNQKISNPEMGNSPRNSSVSYFSRSPSRIVSSSNYASDDDCDKDYDPLTNYLSPRPKYLRFNPSRRREIFDRLEKEGKEDLNSSLDSEEFNDGEKSLEEETKDSSFTPTKESIINEKNEENTEENDDYEEEEEQEEEEEDELEEERGWCLKGVLKLLFTLIACLLSTSYICTMNSPMPSPAQQGISNLTDGYLVIKKQALEVINMRMHDSGFVQVDVGDGFGEVEGVEISEDDNGRTEESVEAEVVEDNVEYSDGCDNVVGNEKKDSQEKVDVEVAEIEVVRGGELVVEADNFEHFVPPRSDEIESFVVEEEVESSYPDLEENNVAKTDEGDQDSCGYGLENELEGLNQLHDLELPVKPISEEETPQGSKGVDETEPLEHIASHEKLTNSVHKVDETGYDNEVIIAVSVVTVILTSLALVYRTKKARNVSAQEPEPQNFAVEEKVATPVLPPVKRKIEFFSRPSLSHRMEKASGEISHHIGAPHVELIGEIVVGQMSSRKHEMSESEKKSATFSTPIQPSQLECSTASSTSYGSFTTETKIMKKEGGQSGEAMVEVTPVRRSSRLRNRAAAMSP